MRSSTKQSINVAIIGAGISGLASGKLLHDQGVGVTVFEKSRGVGGRMATRRLNEENSTFDHGAQYFTARDPRFINYVNNWREQGLVARWPAIELGKDQRIVVLRNGQLQIKPATEDRFVAIPAMNQICKRLSQELTIKKQVRIKSIIPIDERYGLIADNGDSLGTFDKVIVSIPAAQASALLESFPSLSQSLSHIEMKPCWATMAAFSDSLTDEWVGAFMEDSLLSWAARNNTKPGRNSSPEHLVLHATPDWSDQNWEASPEEVTQKMLADFWKVSGIEPRKPSYCTAHRWRYAIPAESSKAATYTLDKSKNIICCGDWTLGGRVEAAFLSGLSAAELVLEAISEPINEFEDNQGL